jgi:hypothetical protein
LLVVENKDDAPAVVGGVLNVLCLTKHSASDARSYEKTYRSFLFDGHLARHVLITLRELRGFRFSRPVDQLAVK